MMTARTVEKARLAPANAVAVGFVLLSSLLYVLGYSLSKVLVGTFGLTPLQVTFLRCVLVFTVTCPAALAGSRTGITWQRIWRPAKAWQQRAAAAALVTSNCLAVFAYSLMPVTEASALSFTAPLLLTALGGLLLREQIPVNRWLGAGAGFGGMLLVVKPEVGPSLLGIAASIGAALTYASYQILVRRLRDVATSLDTAIQVAVIGVALLAGTMLVFWRPTAPGAFGVAVIFTLVQTAALVSIAAAMRRSEASRLAPWQFSGLLWAMLLDVIMFGGRPSVGSAMGGTLIIAGGVLAQGGLWQGKPR